MKTGSDAAARPRPGTGQAAAGLCTRLVLYGQSLTECAGPGRCPAPLAARCPLAGRSAARRRRR